LKALNAGKLPSVIRNGALIILPRGKRPGVYRVFSVKNNKSGMALDLGIPDELRATWINVLVKSLVRDGMTTILGPLTGRSILP
jgi:hypothetical protein